MSVNANVNLNQAQCIVEKTHFGKTAYHNICTNTIVEVPWAFLDWLGFVGFGAICAFVLLMFLSLIFR